jgi:hypothetical protein
MDKILIVLSGETFRDGGNAVRTSGNNNKSIQQQICAINSHIRLFKKIENEYSIKSDVFINTYRSNGHEDLMLELYKEYLIDYKIHENRLRDEFDMIEDTLDRIKNINIEKYQSVLFIRNDIYLKKYFIDIFRFDENRVLYAFIDSNPSFNMLCESMNMETCLNFDPINHLISLVPKKHFNLLLDCKAWYWHYSANRLMSKLGGNAHENIGLFIDTLHWCNCIHDWNPIYAQVGRYNSYSYENCSKIQSNVSPSEFIVASKGIRYDIDKCERYLIECDNIYDCLRENENKENEEFHLFY